MKHAVVERQPQTLARTLQPVGGGAWQANLLLAWRFLAHGDNFDTAVEATMRADVMWAPRSVALRAVDKLYGSQAVVGATLIPSSS